MELDITFKHMNSTEALKEHVEKRAERIQKLLKYSIKLHVILSVEKEMQTAELTCHVEHKSHVAIAKSRNLYESIDQAVAKLESQIKKDREKRKGHELAHLVNRSSSERLANDVDAEIPHKRKNRA